MQFHGVVWPLLAIGLAVPLAAQTQPNFSGRWILNLEKSRLEIPKPTSTRFTIEHREPAFRLTRTHVYGEKTDTLTLDLAADATERAHDAAGSRALIRLSWEGSALLAEMKVSHDGNQGTNLVRYSLADEGRTFIGAERFRSAKLNYDNLWIFDREARLDEPLRRELVAMRAADLHLRDAGDPEMHGKHASRLRELIDRYGWPGEDIAGKDGAEAAWLVALHSGDPAFQRRALQLLQSSAAEGRVPAWQSERLQGQIAGSPSGPRVAGIGGFFFRSAEPAALQKWYQAQFGIHAPASYQDTVWMQEAGPTVFNAFPKSTSYFGRPEQMWMINFRVTDLDAIVAQLRKTGIEVEVDPKEYPNGRFARLRDPEGNPIQLWQFKSPVQ